MTSKLDKGVRQQQIIQLVRQSTGQRMLGTRELALKFGVSEMTVRRDFQELSLDGSFQRKYGGVVSMIESPPALRKEIGIWLVSKTGKYSDPFFNAILEGADRRFQELGYRIAYINTRSGISTVEHARTLLQSHPVDGIILLGFIIPESVQFLRENVRAIIQTTDMIDPELDMVTFDGYYGMRQVIDHLVKQGYRRLGFITGKYELRYQGFTDGIRAHGLSDDESLRVIVPFGLDGWTSELGQVGAQQLMQLPTPPDAIVCASDRIAIGALQWLHQHNMRVPDDVAVTGFDDIAEAQFTVPQLTTVHVHKQLIGELAAERIVERIENDQSVPLFIQTPTRLVVRQSSGSGDTRMGQAVQLP